MSRVVETFFSVHGRAVAGWTITWNVFGWPKTLNLLNPPSSAAALMFDGRRCGNSSCDMSFARALAPKKSRL
jgi:hypothetical protein